MTGTGAGALAPGEGPAARLDCTGMLCPQPIIRLAKAAAELGQGDVVELLSDDPAAAVDVAAWCRMRGHELLASEPPRYVVRLAGLG
jgi:tRNA 2-thiouridine synthesizing protein A